MKRTTRFPLMILLAVFAVAAAEVKINRIANRHAHLFALHLLMSVRPRLTPELAASINTRL
jgi:hypothetical protein